jgi:oligoribonuclease NrnB/cAMP/cGMP phosphodiesterase (DHH superfamily)
MTDSRPLVIYHAGCDDGWCAAWVCLLKYPNAETHAASYGDAPPDVTGRDVLIVDFSWHRSVLEDMNARARSLVVLDHHVSRADDLAGLDFVHYNPDASGAGMAWAYLFPDRLTAPWLVRYVEDRDLWRHALPDSKLVNAYISTFEIGDRGPWDAHMGYVVPGYVVERGHGARAQIDSYVRRAACEAVLGSIDGHQVPVVNAARPFTSDLVGHLAEVSGAPFAAGWRRADGVYEYSLRARGDFDVVTLAKARGGGGHRAAAGFRSDRLIHVVGT